MSNVLLLYESYEPTNAESLRGLKYAESINKISLRAIRSCELKKDDFDWCDVVYAVRPTSSLESDLARYAKKKGKYWITLLDDDFLSLGLNYGKDGQGYRTAKKKALINTLRNTQCLAVSNRLLAEKYKKYGKFARIVMLNSAIDCEKMVFHDKENAKKKIVFYVNDGTKGIFDLCLKPIIPELIKKYQKKVALYFLAVKPDLSQYENSIEIHYIPHMDYEHFLEYLSSGNFDIGLAPLDDSGFAKYKYFNKYIEYTRAGIAGIYSDCSIYRQVVKDGYNGFICANTAEDWMKAIERYVENDCVRRTVAKNAQIYARENFKPENVIEKLLTDIPEMVWYKASGKKTSLVSLCYFKCRYVFFRIGGWFYTIITCIKNGNIKGLLNRFNQRILKRGC